MHVDRARLEALLDERVHQDDGIDSAGKPGEEAFAAKVFDRAPDGGGDVSAPGLP